LDVAEGELIVFTDDDVKPNPNWLTAYWEAYQERPEGYYFGGPVESEHEGEPPDEELLEIAMASVSGLDYGSESGRLDSNDKFLGANWACPAVHLRRVGEFNEGLGLNASASNVSVGEETDMMIRLENIGIKKWYVSRAKLKHYVPEEKCSLDHIARRRIAEKMKNRRSNKEKPKDLCGFPIGIYKAYISNAAKYILCRVLGGKGIKERFEMERWRRRINNF
jgi:GT2 family glycosyltransferase